MTSTSRIFNLDALQVIGMELEECNTVNDFLARVDTIANDSDYTISYPTEIQIEFPLDPSVNADGQNAKYIYEAVGSTVRPANASDPRLWSYLSLVQFRDYVTRRWAPDDDKDVREHIRTRWFLQDSDPRKLVRNGIARLWWVANYTIDDDFEHPLSAATGNQYAYTEWMFDKQERVQSFFERTIARSPKLIWPIMENLEPVRVSNNREVTRAFATAVNLRTGYRRLESLSDAELNEVIRELVDETVANHGKRTD